MRSGEEFSGVNCGTIGTIEKVGDNNEVLIGGIKDNRIWYGLFDDETKELLYQWWDHAELERVVSIFTGYGNYLDFKLDYLSTHEIQKTSKGYLTSLLPSGYKVCFLNKDKPMALINLKKNANFPVIQDWFNNSVLIKEFEDPSKHEFSYSVYELNGSFIKSFTNDRITLLDDSNWYSCSYTDIIGIVINDKYSAIQRVNLSDDYDGEEIWSTQIDHFASFSGSVLISSKLISVNDKLWEMEYEAVEFYSEKVKIHFVINIDNGEIEYL